MQETRKSTAVHLFLNRIYLGKFEFLFFYSPVQHRPACDGWAGDGGEAAEVVGQKVANRVLKKKEKGGENDNKFGQAWHVRWTQKRNNNNIAEADSQSGFVFTA